jgi:hypothetical protein
MAEMNCGYREALSVPVMAAFDLMGHHSRNNEVNS